MTFVYRFTWWICRILFGTYFRWRVHNPENVPIEGPVILASNHASFLDPPLIGSAIPRPINYLARESLFRAPLVGTYFRALNSVPVDRDGAGAKGLKMILNRLLGGGGIILFPEGTRTSDDKLQPARSGVGLTVIKSTAPVVPVRVFGTFQAWNRKMMEFRELREEAKTCDKKRLKIIYQEVADQIMAEIGKLSVG
jgi:1-acyl-sn-glycerol-3-phosphate acyltransferase